MPNYHGMGDAHIWRLVGLGGLEGMYVDGDSEMQNTNDLFLAPLTAY